MKKAVWAVVPLVFFSCQRPLPLSERMLVIDGRIGSGEHPEVSVTLNLPVSEEAVDSADLEALVVRWADVRVDGSTLIGHRDGTVFPPYVYTEWSMRGEEGKTYHLEVSYAGMRVEAVTTVPVAVPIDSVSVESIADSLCRVWVHFKDPPSRGDRYRLFVREEGETQFQPALLGVLSDENLTLEDAEIELFRPLGLSFSSYSPYYKEGTRLEVKLCTMDEAAYQYWKDFDGSQMLSSSAFYPATLSLKSNIEGGLGLWAGYGVSKYSFVIEP